MARTPAEYKDPTKVVRRAGINHTRRHWHWHRGLPGEYQRHLKLGRSSRLCSQMEDEKYARSQRSRYASQMVLGNAQTRFATACMLANSAALSDTTPMPATWHPRDTPTRGGLPKPAKQFPPKARLRAVRMVRRSTISSPKAARKVGASTAERKVATRAEARKARMDPYIEMPRSRTGWDQRMKLWAWRARSGELLPI